jgi:O-antigen/teichoic acid export membrane protein
MSLRRAAASGVLWTGAATAAVMVMRLVTLAVIARYVTQAELGLVSMLMAIMIMMQAFSDFGLSTVIVQRASFTREQLSSLFWLAQAAGVVSLLLVITFEGAVVELYGDQRLEGLIGWLALRFVLTPIGIPFSAMLQRDLQFRRAFWIQTSSTVLGAAVTIAGAVGGHGIYALIAGELTSAASSAGLALILGWHTWTPQLRFRLDDLREPLRFSLFQIGERVFNLFATNIDYIFVGRMLGASAVGVYALAFELVSIPARLNAVLTRVAFPVLARKQDDPEGFRRGFLDLIRFIALVQLPMLVGMAALAPVFVPVFLGPGWEHVVPLIQILSVFGAIRVVGNPSGPAFLAKGRPELGFYFNFVLAVVALIAFWLVVDRGLEAVAWTWVILILGQVGALIVVLNKLTDLTWRRWGTTLARPLLLSALSTAYLLAGSFVGDRCTTSLVSRLLIALSIGGALTVATAWRLERGFLSSMFALLRRPVAAP